MFIHVHVCVYTFSYMSFYIVQRNVYTCLDMSLYMLMCVIYTLLYVLLIHVHRCSLYSLDLSLYICLCVCIQLYTCCLYKFRYEVSTCWYVMFSNVSMFFFYTLLYMIIYEFIHFWYAFNTFAYMTFIRICISFYTRLCREYGTVFLFRNCLLFVQRIYIKK